MIDIVDGQPPQETRTVYLDWKGRPHVTAEEARRETLRMTSINIEELSTRDHRGSADAATIVRNLDQINALADVYLAWEAIRP